MIYGKKNITTVLRHRLTLQEEIRTMDGAGGYIGVWQDVADLWAEISPISTRVIYGNEKLFAGQIQSSLSHKITIRYRSNISTAMRFIFQGRAFNIRSISSVHEKKDIIELLVEEGVAN